MKHWLVLTGLRLAIALLAVALLAWLFVIKPSHDAKSLIKKEQAAYNSADDSIHKAQQIMSAEPDIRGVGPQQPGNFAAFADESKTLLIRLQKLKIEDIKASQIKSVGLGSRALIKDADSALKQTDNGTFDSAQNNLSDAGKLLNYQHQVSSMLVNILEYNPTADTAGFALGSDDTNQRLALAKKGLAKAQANLNNLKGKYNDHGLDEDISQIEALQNSRDRLASAGDKNVWINSVAQAQATIIASRQNFWQQNSAEILVNLLSDFNKLSIGQQRWHELAVKYNLK